MGAGCAKNKSKNSAAFYEPGKDKEASTIFAGKTKDIREDRFTSVKVTEEKSVLVAKYDRKYYAIGDTCPHSGTSLADAPIRYGRVRCVAHGACFDIESGEIEDFPGFECIPTYKTQVKLGSVYVKVNPKKMPVRIMRPMVTMTDESISVVIIGGGAAGYTCAQTLREEGYNGRIIMVTQDKYLPYDRTKLSKVPHCDFDSTRIRGATFYQDNEIEVLLETTVRKVDPSRNCLYFEGSNNPELLYDNLFIATGLRPRYYTRSMRGSSLNNIFILRTLEDQEAICSQAEGKEVVVIVGSSFVSMEMAEMLSPIVKSIHILSRSKFPYGPVFGETASAALLEHFLAKLPNVTFHPTDEVGQFFGTNDGDLAAVYTFKKQTITAQMAILGIGALPNTEFLERTGMILNPVDHSIIVNKYMETSIPHIYAGGDVVSFPFYLCSKDRAMVTHWQIACVHGKVAALNMLGKEIRIEDVVPYFWTKVCGVTVSYLGYGEGYDETLIFGIPEELNFCCVYRRRQRLNAICCVGCGRLAAELALVLETEKEWIVDIPDPIRKAFPGPPTNAETSHAIKHETHTKAHDAAVLKIAPIPMEPFEIELENRRRLRTRLVPIGFDLIMQGHDGQDPDKALAHEIHNMRRDQEDRRRAENIRHGKVLGNLPKNKEDIK